MLEQALFSALNGATDAGDRVFPMVRPQESGVPAVTYQRVSNVPTTSLAGDSGLDSVRVQIDAWASTYANAKALAAQVRSALLGAAFKALMVSDFDDYETETQTYRVSMDFNCWHRL